MNIGRYCIFVQARMSSSRLPGKVAEDIYGKPMLLRQLERLRKANDKIDVVCVTSVDIRDDAIYEICTQADFLCFRGSLDNVLDRYISAATLNNVETIIRVGGDDPLVDAHQIEGLITQYEDKEADFLFTSHRNGWPMGSAVELISVAALQDIARQTTDALYLEHIIPWFHHNENDFRCVPVNSPSHLRRPDYYFTVDYPEDLLMVKQIFKNLLVLGDYFRFQDVIEFCDKNPEILSINEHLHEGFDL